VSPAGCQILLLEDDPAVAALVATALKEAGFSNVRTSSSISGARQCWHAQFGKFDLFLTDFSLPDGCASDFIQELLRYNPDLHVILMSGFSEEALELDGEWARKAKVLQKPFMPSELVEAVDSAMK
jgi:two-component system, cell cycle sensor histidine kinase and response regulator CckA